MSALDGVLAELVDADRDCAYVTVKREPLESLIAEWSRRGDQIAIFCGLLVLARTEVMRAWRNDCASNEPLEEGLQATLRGLSAGVTESARAIANHRHAVRDEFAARLKQVLRSTAAELSDSAAEKLRKGEQELAERLESDRQTLRILISTVDTVLDRLLRDELRAAAGGYGQSPQFPAANPR